MDKKLKELIDAANAVTGAWGDGGNDKRMAPLIIRLNNAVKVFENEGVRE